MSIRASRWVRLSAAVGLVAAVQIPITSQSQPVRFSAVVDGKAFSSPAAQTIGLARGKPMFLMPDKDLLLYAGTGGSTSSMPAPGFRQRLLDVGQDEPLTLVLNLASSFPDDPKKVLGVTLMIYPVSQKLLAGLPVSARVGAASGPTLAATVSYGVGLTFPSAASGQVTIEALDLKQRSVRGSFSLTTTPGMINKEKPLVLTGGRFDIPALTR